MQGYNGFTPYQNNYGQPMQPSPQIAEYQRRMAELDQQYQQMRQHGYQQSQAAPMAQQQAMQQAPVPRSILVTSIDEAKAYNVLDGSLYIFRDTSNGKIYTRQFNVQTGTASLDIFEKTSPADPAAESPATEEQDEMKLVYSKLADLEAKYADLEARINVQSANDCKQDDTTKSTGPSDDAAATGDAATGARAKRNSGQPAQKPA